MSEGWKRSAFNLSSECSLAAYCSKGKRPLLY